MPRVEAAACGSYYLPPQHWTHGAEMGERLFLKTLGPPELTGAEGRALKFKVRKHLALLIYLAVDYRATHTRDALVELFWGGVEVERGRHSLSVALSVLRAIVGADSIRSTNLQVRLIRSGLTIDLDLLQRGAILGVGSDPPIEVDRFLLDFEIDDAPAFQHWRDRRYAQLLPSIQAALLTVIDHARRSGDPRRVLTFADRLLALDPLSEEGIKARVLALAMQGDRVSALRAYEEWKREMLRQLGAAPSELLEGIAARLRCRGVERAGGAMGPAVPSDQRGDRRFVGRTAEFRDLVDAWDSTTQFNTRHILLTGESGIGKSTLALRFGASVALEGAAVARVQCFELEQRIAFGMIGALVSSLLDQPGAVATAPESLAEIARVVPRVRERFPHLPAPRRTEGETARIHFAEGVFALFDAIMDEQPLLLIVDDYPRSDEASLSVLHMLLRRTGTDRAMVVLTGRPAEVGESAQVRRIRDGVSYLPMRHIELSPLTEQEGDSMLTALLSGAGKEAAAPVRRAILQAGRGNPMALDLLAQDWTVHGEAAMAVSLPAMSSDMPASALEAVGYDRLIERMLPDLAPRTRTALQLAAILGPRLNDLESFDIADLTPAQTLAAMTDLVDRRLLRDVGGRLEFTNELIRARLYLKIPSAARIRLHGGVANRLLVAVQLGENVPGLEIAWHCIRARRRDEATPFLMSGAREAILHGAPDEAVRALASALGHLRGRAKDEAAVLLAESYQEMGDWKAALGCLSQLPRDRSSEDPLREIAHILEVESRRELGEFSTTELTTIAERLTVTARNHRTPVLVRVQSALTAARIGGTLVAIPLLESIDQMLDDIPATDLDQRTQTKLLFAKGYTQYQLRRNTEGHSKTLAVARLLEDAGAADSTYVQIQMGLGVFRCVSGAYSDAMPYFEKSFRAAGNLDNAALMSQVAGNLALCNYRLGCPEEQLRWAKLAEESSIGLHPGSFSRILAATFSSLASIALGRREQAKTALNRLRAAKERAESYWAWQSALLWEADIQWIMGDKNGAFKTLADVLKLDREKAGVGFEGKFVRWRTLFSVRQNSFEEVSEMLNAFYGEIDRYDLIDQAEILCSMELVERCTGAAPSEITNQARAVLARLPMACSHQLQQLGLLLTN